VAGVALIGGLVCLVAARNKSAARATAIAPLCCLDAVDAIPAGQFTYATVGSSWNYAISQGNVGARNQSIASKLDPILRESETVLSLATTQIDSLDEAIEAVKASEADFAVVPLVTTEGESVDIPVGFAQETIAYDGIAAVVSFSYAGRSQGLPDALGGEISLDDLRQIYTNEVKLWRRLSRASLSITTYASLAAELSIFEQKVLGSVSLEQLAADPLEPESQALQRLTTLNMLRAIIHDFEVRQVGGIGLVPLSQVVGQCSVYPLAVSAPGGRAVQPWQLAPDVPIEPTTDLCDRKGQYQPNIEAFRQGSYPLAYSIVVVYPQDNSRLPIGQKFAELMQTDEGQYLLSEAGLVPLRSLETYSPEMSPRETPRLGEQQ